MKSILLTALSIMLFACDAVDIPADSGLDESAETGDTIEEGDALAPRAAEAPVAEEEPALVTSLASCGNTPLYRYTCLTACWYQVGSGVCSGKDYYWLCRRNVQWKMADSADMLESWSDVKYCSQANSCPGTCN